MLHTKIKFIVLLITYIIPGEISGVFGAEFGYGVADGPHRWAIQYPTCNDRRANSRQSPININTRRAKPYAFAPLQIPRTKITDVAIINTGTTVELKFKNDNEKPKISGGPMYNHIFKFEQLHFHWSEKGRPGSENKIDSRASDMELHMVFYNTKYGTFKQATAENQTNRDALVVLGVFVNATNRDSEVFKFTDEISKIVEPESSTPYNYRINFYDLLPSNLDEYFTFAGSLTTPPCSEIVTWIVFWNPIFISNRQLDQFRQIRDKNGGLVTRNSRPTQRTNKRLLRYPKQLSLPFFDIPNTIKDIFDNSDSSEDAS